LEVLNILFKRLTQRAAENDEDERKALDDGGWLQRREVPACSVNKSRFPTPPHLPIVLFRASALGCDRHSAFKTWSLKNVVKIQ
jgi:hypothetical protein